MTSLSAVSHEPLGCSLFADPYTMDLLQGERPEILTGIGEGIEIEAFGVQKL